MTEKSEAAGSTPPSIAKRLKDEAQAIAHQRLRVALAPGEVDGQNKPMWPDTEVRLTDVFGNRVWSLRRVP